MAKFELSTATKAKLAKACIPKKSPLDLFYKPYRSSFSIDLAKQKAEGDFEVDNLSSSVLSKNEQNEVRA